MPRCTNIVVLFTCHLVSPLKTQTNLTEISRKAPQVLQRVRRSLPEFAYWALTRSICPSVWTKIGILVCYRSDTWRNLDAAAVREGYMKKILMPAIFASLMLVLLAASPVFASFRMAGAEPGGKDNPGPPIYYVVQFEGPIQQEWKDQVTAQGGELLGYIPYFAFKVRMNPAQAREVKELESVGAVLPFLPKYKLSPRLASEGTNLYRVKVERGADAGLVAAAIARTDAQIMARQGNILVVGADGEQIQPISEILDVAWVENFQFHQKYNDGAGAIMGADMGWTRGYDGSS